MHGIFWDLVPADPLLIPGCAGLHQAYRCESFDIWSVKELRIQGAGKGALAINKRASDIRMGDLVWALNVNNTAATPSIVVGATLLTRLRGGRRTQGAADLSVRKGFFLCRRIGGQECGPLQPADAVWHDHC